MQLCKKRNVIRIRNQTTPVIGLQNFSTLPATKIRGTFEHMEVEYQELINKHSISDAFSTTFVSHHMLHDQDLYADNYNETLLAFADYCFYSKVEDERKFGEVTEEEQEEFNRKNEAEDVDEIGEIHYKGTTIFFWKGDCKGLSMKHWISNNTIDIYSLFLNINQLSNKGDAIKCFYFNCYCYVSIIYSTRKMTSYFKILYIT